MFNNICAGCPLNGTSKKSKAKGNKTAKFLVVGKAPTDEMIEQGKHMSDSAMRILAKHLKLLGFEKEDFVFTSSVRCNFDQLLYPAKEKREIKKHCREWLVKVIKEMKPEAILTLGVDATSAVMGRQVKITKVQGVPVYSDEFSCMVVPTTDPAQVHSYPQHEPIFASDCKTFARIIDYSYNLDLVKKDLVGDYKEVQDLGFLLKYKDKVLSFDLETLGTRFAAPEAKILTMQFSIEPGRGFLLSWDHPDNPKTSVQKRKIKKQLEQILLRNKIIGQNLKYDADWILYHLGFRFRVYSDTIMLAAIHDENMLNKDLDTLVKVYVPEMAGYADWFNNKYDKSRMDLVPLEDIVDYGCGDVDAVIRLNKIFLDKLGEDTRLENHYWNVSIPGINAFIPIETRGMLIDIQALKDFEVVLSEDVEQQRINLLKQVDKNIKRKHIVYGDAKSIKKSLSFSRAAFTLDVLFNHPKGFKLKPKVYTKSTKKLQPHLRVPSISSKDHLPYFFEECPFTEQLANYIKDERILSTNVKRFQEHYLIDNYIYPSYALWVTVTGRTSSRDPNGQNFPKRGKAGKAYRRIFTTPDKETYVLLEGDYSQAELRIVADMSNDPVMIETYRNNGDIHLLTAANTTNINVEKFSNGKRDKTPLIEVANGWPGSGVFLRSFSPGKRKIISVADYVAFKRFQAKAVNFGYVFGMGYRKFITYAKTQYGIEFTDEEAEDSRDQFFYTYPNLGDWHTAMRDFATENGYVRSYSGRVRHLPMVWSEEIVISEEAKRQAINAPVQEFASTLGVLATSRLDQEIDTRCLMVSGFVHDAIYALVPIKYLEWGAQTLKYYMESNPIKELFGVNMKVPLVADIKFGINGDAMDEMQNLNFNRRYDFSIHNEFLEKHGIRLPKQYKPSNNGRI